MLGDPRCRPPSTSEVDPDVTFAAEADGYVDLQTLERWTRNANLSSDRPDPVDAPIDLCHGLVQFSFSTASVLN